MFNKDTSLGSAGLHLLVRAYHIRPDLYKVRAAGAAGGPAATPSTLLHPGSCQVLVNAVRRGGLSLPKRRVWLVLRRDRLLYTRERTDSRVQEYHLEMPWNHKEVFFSVTPLYVPAEYR